MSAPRGAGHKWAGWSHSIIPWALSGNKALLVADAIYGYGVSIWQDRTNCHWGKFPKYAGNKNSCPDFWCIIELEPDNGLEHFSRMWLTLAGQEHSSDPAVTLQKGCSAFTGCGGGCVQACSEFPWFLHHPGLKPGQCFPSLKAASRHKIKIVKLILLWHLALSTKTETYNLIYYFTVHLKAILAYGLTDKLLSYLFIFFGLHL